ncbi:MAG: type III pantothenate kinase [Porticoccaceae bacterium]
MIVDVDIGNTRIKWRLRDARGNITDSGAASHHHWADQIFSFDSQIERVRIASVVDSVSAVVAAQCRQRWHIEPEMAAVCDGAAGVVCGYKQPEKLGVDRWLGALAGWVKCKTGFLVVDAGSALTLDLVDSFGVHRGGYIVPGYEMMKNALGFNTWGVKVEKRLQPTLELGTDTSAAVQHGCLGALAGLVELAVRRNGVATLFVTGGDGERVVEHLKLDGINVALTPNLVLDGLAIAIP